MSTPQMTRRRAVTALASTALLVALAGCGGGSGESDGSSGADDPALAPLIKAAKKEGTVVFYGGQAETVLQQIQEKFQKKYGIQVKYQRLASGPQRQRIDQELKSGKVMFDVSQLSDEAWVEESAGQGAWMDLDPAKLPELAKIPTKFQHKSYVASSLVPLNLIYNSDKLSADEVPKTSDDLSNPKWRGRFAIVDPGTGLSIRTGYYVWLQKYGEDGFTTFMQNLFAQQPRVVQSGSNGVQQVAAGELDFVLLASASFATEAKAQGAPVAIAYPDPTAVTVRSLQVAKQASHPNAGQLLLNWLASSEGLEVLNGKEQAAAPYPGAARTGLTLPASVKVPKPSDVAAQSDRIQQAFASVSR